MKAVIQKVVNASVAVDGQTISSIGRGLLVLVGIDRYDTPSDATQIIKKILSARLFEDEHGSHWKKNVRDIEGEVLCVSQFTLLAGFKGSKPDFHESMSTIPSKAYYASFLEEIKKAYHPSKIKDGEFGAMMQVSLTNDGPVTILLSSRDKVSSSSSKPSSPIPNGSANTTAEPSRASTPASSALIDGSGVAENSQGKGKIKIKNKGTMHPKFGSKSDTSPAPADPSAIPRPNPLDSAGSITAPTMTMTGVDSATATATGTSPSNEAERPPESSGVVAPV
ncbi:D-tyrosyl-tRNA(Tyr) deacylase [Kwoniella heveanensis BCC8398]|uniref:D-aminoacyl-tRNA deacylase n=1 Tax=Kwoniella heveanensis BCC8398 TaxID=1296120 RepID=A0A1B9GZU7_9TREE|nr:D-tyrosyl-tRNA(Tyr) deacylase [Kwoniella heveanensis BCC8398]